MGPLIIDCQQQALLPEEREKLAHPLTGGVILFSRNFFDVAQLKALISDIRAAAGKPLLIAVDHEGGRVQRFRDGFTALPAMGDIVPVSDSAKESAGIAYACGVVMAYELKSLDIDLSFAPVADVNGISEVIGDRAFASNADEVVRLASALMKGMRQLNMPTTGKHFPGHGSVQADSHIAVPVDERPLKAIAANDLSVFEALIASQQLDAIMPAHVIYPDVDTLPAGFSAIWLQQILREKLGFNGLIFSDDLSMQGASVAGDYLSRAHAAIAAGCDMLLACNNPSGAEKILDGLAHQSCERLSPLLRRALPAPAQQAYTEARAVLARFT